MYFKNCRDIYCIVLERDFMWGFFCWRRTLRRLFWTCGFILIIWCFGYDKYFSVICDYMCRGKDFGWELGKLNFYFCFMIKNIVVIIVSIY